MDPQRDAERCTSDAGRLGCRIAHVFLTHFHADFLAGHLELRDREGATIHLSAQSSAEHAFTPMSDGSTMCLGSVRLVVLETPGHSRESISILVYDGEHDDAPPHAVLTGDTLFIGDVGRPDLHAPLGWSSRDLAGLLYDSLHGKLARLPDEPLVYPAHGAGFIGLVTAGLPDAPPYFTHDAVLNARERLTLERALVQELNLLSLERALELERDGAQLLETRDPAQFEAPHLRGSLNIGLGGSYARAARSSTASGGSC